MHRLRGIRSRLYPARAWLTVLVAVFVIESTIMLVMSLVLRIEREELLVAFVDAAILTLCVAPILWWNIVRPLQALLNLRTQHLAELFGSIEEERRRVAMELHDGAGQYLTILVSGLKTVAQTDELPEVKRRCVDLQQAAQDALAEVRRITLGLRPSVLDDLGLGPAVSRLADDVRVHHGIALALDVDALPGRLPRPVENAAFRIIQEALNNVVKHSHARSAHVSLAVRNDQLVIEVEDDGCGLPDALRGHWNVNTGHLGLLGMRERAVLLGGDLSIRSDPAHGTRVAATIPLGATRDPEDANPRR